MNFAAQTGARPRIHKQNTKFPKEKSKFRGFLIAKNLDLVYNKKRIVRTLKFRKTEGKDIMRKFIKKILAVSVAAALTAGALSLAGCAFFVTFGGACVLAQQLAFLTKAGVKALPFLAVKFLQGLLAAGIAYGLGLLLF